jgi:choline dehydrogenase-like flavoprotein
VNILNRTVGGTTIHADMKFPRFNEVDFRLASALSAAGRLPADTSFIDWPVTYDELEPWYTEAENITGVAGLAGSDPFASHRSGPYPMPPSAEMYVGRLLSAGATKAGYAPFHYPAAINSRPYPPIPALAAAPVRELRLLLRLRLPQQLEELGGGHDPARLAAQRPLPAPLQLATSAA